MLKQSKSPIWSQTNFLGFHTDANSSGLWENVELTENKKSTYQDGATLGVVLDQGYKGVFGDIMELWGERGAPPMIGRRGEGTIPTNEEFIVPPI